ncbi:MAG: biotin--[acetyl-CoA-carboxylase] ligase [Planctomycetota bacterium]|nr:MAG: biotin--[acetyl-CoA-carboxylase] ligase [Planctomycetota bacterium]
MPTTERLDPDIIGANLKTNRIGRKILVYKTTSSTNDIAAKYAKNKDNDGLAIFTEEQTAGRGRAGTKWHSGRADSILCSIVLTDCECNAELLSLACAVAVAEAIGKPANKQTKIKWPNDIIVSGKKVAGILLESKAIDGSTVYILGIGINCHQKKKSFPAELQQTATSIDIESRSIVDRNSLAKRLLTSIDHWLEMAQKDSDRVTNRWRDLSIQLGHGVTLLYNRRKFSGNCIGVDPEKGLILELESGARKFFDAAHTSIVK